MAVKTLHDVLAAASTVTSLVSDRITPLNRPQDLTLPAITLSRITLTPVNAIDQWAGLDGNTVQLDAWATTYKGARDLASACRTAIQSAGYAMQSELDNFDPSAELSGVYRVTQEYQVWI